MTIRIATRCASDLHAKQVIAPGSPGGAMYSRGRSSRSADGSDVHEMGTGRLVPVSIWLASLATAVSTFSVGMATARAQ
jgi:hypothetical protein